MSIISRTPNMGLTQWDGDIASRAGIYSRYNSDMETIDTEFHALDETVNGENGLGAKVSALETTVGTLSESVAGAVETANQAKDTADGMDGRVTAVEGRLDAYDLWKVDVDNTLTAYDGRLDAIEDVIETVSTANINDLIARMDALEQKVDANTQGIDTLNDNLIGAVNRITDLETELGNTNANLNALTGRVTTLEGCCEEVRDTLADHNTRINKNASDISALDARLTRDETNIAGNASDITILATQNNTQAGQIDDLYTKYNALDPASPSSLISRVTTLEGVVGDTPLQTVAQTVTGAINELYGHATDVDADEVDYDNSNSGLVATDVQGAIDEVNGKVDVDSARIGALETTVGGAGSGLVKDVGDLQTIVGDNTAGLVKDVADLGTTVGDSSAGLVKDVADLQTTVGDSTAGLVKDVTDLQTDVAKLSTPTGIIVPFGGATAPTSWLLCDGSAVSRETYADLFAVIGTAFGSGDGSTTFNIPDMRECTAKGAGLYGGTVGAHVDADGLAVGEFLDDRVQEHIHQGTTPFYTGGGSSYPYNPPTVQGSYQTNPTKENNGRKGVTTEVKSIGVNYIIKI